MNETKRKLGALDIFIIVIAVLLIAGIGVRFFLTRNSNVNEKTDLEEYIVSFKIMDIRDTSAQNYFNPGTNFYVDQDGSFFGTLQEGLRVSDAKRYYYLDSGEVITSLNNATGDLYRVDVEGSFKVSGITAADGKFLLNGNTYIAENKEVKVYSKYLSVMLLITSVTKA
ncbi:MAG: hypothetical protein IJU57_03440 [Clostridia bacterium]|nr:hypothetical protein [Clostridia bacterium]